MAQLRRLFKRPQQTGRKAHFTNKKGEYFKALWQMFDKQCAYCWKPLQFMAATRDHLKPLAHGGASGIQNVVPACKKCNHDKGHEKAITFLNINGYDTDAVLARIGSVRQKFNAWCVEKRARRTKEIATNAERKVKPTGEGTSRGGG